MCNLNFPWETSQQFTHSHFKTQLNIPYYTWCSVGLFKKITIQSVNSSI
ncbi:Uncharacterised protein [Mycobacteroides abscessus subsp. abscessus]|nr:Uncharacterised protein [Mycobacteroides abscessus subsp. abscessus]